MVALGRGGLLVSDARALWWSYGRGAFLVSEVPLYRGTKQPPPLRTPTLDLCIGPYGGPREGGADYK